MNNLDQFLADFPFRCFIPEEAEPAQTAEQAKVLIQRAEAKKQRIRARNLKNKANGGFVFENDLNLDRGSQYYTSKRGERRRYQLGRD